jgi:hypothetical protein
VTATFSGRFFASRDEIAQVLMGFRNENAVGCDHDGDRRDVRELQLGLPAAWVPNVSPVMIDIV